MLKFLIFCSVWLVLLVGCKADKDTPAPTEMAVSPTATFVVSNFVGPVLGSGSVGSSESCSEGSSCAVQNVELQPEREALPLTQQTIEEFSVGLPDDYSPLRLRDEVLISATSPETLGGFIVSIRTVDAETLAPLLARFNQPDFEAGSVIEHPTLAGKMLATGERGAIALLTAPDGRQIFVEGSADPGYWTAFHQTFEAMLLTITFA